MSSVIHCPRCHGGIAYHVSQCGSTVACPHCRQPFQIPLRPETPRPDDQGARFDIPDERSPTPTTRYRREKQGGKTGILIGGVILVGAIFIGLWASGILSKDDRRVGNTDTTEQVKSAPKTEPTPNPKGIPVGSGKEKEREKLRGAEEKRKREEKTEEEGIRNAVLLQAPQFGKGTPNDPYWSNIDDFSRRMRDLATNEFKFREAQNTVFQSKFNMQQVWHDPLIKTLLARNAVWSTSKYDFDAGNYSLDLILWYGSSYGESSLGGPVLDICKLQASVKLDPETAQIWRKGIDEGTTSITVWYRFKAVEQQSWKESRRWGNLEHNLAFRVDVIKFAVTPR